MFQCPEHVLSMRVECEQAKSWRALPRAAAQRGRWQPTHTHTHTRSETERAKCSQLCPPRRNREHWHAGPLPTHSSSLEATIGRPLWHCTVTCVTHVRYCVLHAGTSTLLRTTRWHIHVTAHYTLAHPRYCALHAGTSALLRTTCWHIRVTAHYTLAHPRYCALHAGTSALLRTTRWQKQLIR